MSLIDRSYHVLLNKIKRDGFTYRDPNRKGINRIQIPEYKFYHDFEDGFPALTTKRLFFKGVKGETLWILNGGTSIKPLLDNNIHIWNKDAYNYAVKSCNYNKSLEEFVQDVKKGNKFQQYTFRLGELGKVYGYQLRNFNGNFDQLEWLIDTLRNNPLSTKKTVTFINPTDRDDQALTPCHTGFKILVEPLTPEKRKSLHGFREFNEHLPLYGFTLQWEQDSVDTFLGLPFNIASYGLIAHILGKLANMVPLRLIGDLSNVHIYEPHLNSVNLQLSRNSNTFGPCSLHLPEILTSTTRVSDLKSIKLKDIQLKNYESYKSIPEEMFPYNK